MAVEDVFSIEGRGTVATGRIERGVVKVGEEVEIVGLTPESAQDDLHRRGDVQQDAGSGRRPATTSGCLLRGIKREDIERGQVLAKPGSITPAHQVRGRGVRACRRKKAAGTRRSSAATVRSSTSARPT